MLASSAVPGDPGTLAELLVRDALLTPFQVEQLLQKEPYIRRRHAGARRAHGGFQIDDAVFSEDTGALLPLLSVAYESHGLNPG